VHVTLAPHCIVGLRRPVGSAGAANVQPSRST
jgi:hypothetical protein